MSPLPEGPLSGVLRRPSILARCGVVAGESGTAASLLPARCSPAAQGGGRQPSWDQPRWCGSRMKSELAIVHFKCIFAQPEALRPASWKGGAGRFFGAEAIPVLLFAHRALGSCVRPSGRAEAASRAQGDRGQGNGPYLGMDRAWGGGPRGVQLNCECREEGSGGGEGGRQ